MCATAYHIYFTHLLYPSQYFSLFPVVFHVVSSPFHHSSCSPYPLKYHRSSFLFLRKLMMFLFSNLHFLCYSHCLIHSCCSSKQELSKDEEIPAGVFNPCLIYAFIWMDNFISDNSGWFTSLQYTQKGQE